MFAFLAHYSKLFSFMFPYARAHAHAGLSDGHTLAPLVLPSSAPLGYVMAGTKCEGTSREIALDMKAKTSPPLQYDQKKKKEKKRKRGEKVLQRGPLL